MTRFVSQPAWRAALALPAIQAAVGALAAVGAGLVAGPRAGFGVAAGAAAVAVGFLVFGWRTALRPQAVGAVTSFVRLLVGLLLKWAVIAALLVAAWRAGGVDAAGVLAGVLAAYLAYFFTLAWLLR